MFLTDDDINEFIQIYKEEFGEILSFAETSRMAEELMALFIMLVENETEESSSPGSDLDK